MKQVLLSTLLVLFISLTLQSQICSPPTAYAELNIGNCRVGLLNGGDMWWNGVDEPRYEIPKLSPGSGIVPKHTYFTGGLWLSAIDDNNDLKMSGMTYRTQGYEFYPGPLSNVSGSTTIGNCNLFDRFFEITKAEIQAHENLSLSGFPIPLNQIASNILEWPAKGNVHFAGYNIVQDLAPFHDYNQNGIYDPENGDYPKVIGDQSFFWVLNDVGGFQQILGGEPLKVEIHMLAHAFADSNLMNTTIYESTIINKSFGDLSEFYFGFYADPDLGDGTDDMVGCDTTRNASFSYNGNAVDGIYGQNPPITSIQFLNQDLSAFSIFINSGQGVMQDPDYAIDARNRMLGIFEDGTLYCADASVATNCPPTRYMFPGNPNDSLAISMCTASTYDEGDYRTIQSTGPFDLNAWDSLKVAFAVHTTFPSNYTGCPDIDTEFGFEIDTVAYEYDSLLQKIEKLPTGLRAISAINEMIRISPNPSSNHIRIDHGNLQIEKIQILSADGKVVKSLPEDELDDVVYLGDLNDGIYFVAIETDKGLAMKKMVKN